MLRGRHHARFRIGLVVHDVASFGGMDRALLELVQRTGSKYDLTIISRTLPEPIRPCVRWHRVRVPARPIPLKFVAFQIAAGLRLAVEHFDLVCSVGAIVPNEVDVVAVHYCHAGFRRATSRSAPADAPLLRRLNTSLLGTLSIAAERWSYRTGRTRIAVAVSEGVGAELRAAYPGVPVAVVPNGVDAARFAPDEARRRAERDTLGFVDDDVVVLFVGGDWDRKGLTIALEAVAAAQTDGKENVQLVVVGHGDVRRYRATAEALSIGRRVRFIGPRSDVERLYAAADVFVLPSLYETFSLVAYEAAAAALPVVATDVHGVRELVAAGGGLLVERNGQAFAAAISRLRDDPVERRRLGEAGRRYASTLTWERSVAGMLEVFERVLAEKAAVSPSADASRAAR